MCVTGLVLINRFVKDKQRGHVGRAILAIILYVMRMQKMHALAINMTKQAVVRGLIAQRKKILVAIKELLCLCCD